MPEAFEFDPFSHEEVQPEGERHKLVIDEDMVRRALHTELTIPA